MKIVLFKDKWGGITTFNVTDYAYDKYDCVDGWCTPTESLLDYIYESTGIYIQPSCEHEAFYIDTENLGGDLYPKNQPNINIDSFNSICKI